MEKLNAQIIQAKEDQNKANDEKMKLDNKTQTLQKEKDEDTKTIDYLAKTKVQKKEEQTQ